MKKFLIAPALILAAASLTASLPASAASLTEESCALPHIKSVADTEGLDRARALSSACIKRGWLSTKDAAARGWADVKEGTGEGYDASKSAVRKGWDKTKEGASDTWKATKEGASDIKNAIKEKLFN
ncbi:hypothetical protein [Sutterella sp.]|uniref:hypothetical protein n=1 Tax=Sutterella sp. TaxID=1981025 RepID=UPI003FD801A6